MSKKGGYLIIDLKNVIPCTDGLTYRDTYYHGDIENANATDPEYFTIKVSGGPVTNSNYEIAFLG